MKKTRYIPILLTALLLLLCNCKDERENNGDFGGMWQLTQWQTRSSSGQIDSTIATSKNGIYYSVYRVLMQFSINNDTLNTFSSRLFAYFTLTSDSLKIYNIAHAKNDSVTNDMLSIYGIPSDGRFHVDLLNRNNMVLSNKDNKMTFRKY